MSKLFILGNGFDLAHKLDTSYKHFREWLVSNFLEGDNTKTDILKLRDFLEEECKFDEISKQMSYLDYLQSPWENPIYSEKIKKGHEFIKGVAQEWSDIQEGKIEVTGLDKEEVFTSLKKANCKNLLKLYKEMGNNEYSQENMNNAIGKILNEEFGGREILEWESSKGININWINELTDKDKNIVVNIIIATIDSAIGNDWRDFENALGNLELYLLSENKDSEQAQIKQALYHRLFMAALSRINEFFKGWIQTIEETIDLNKGQINIKENFINRINKEKDLFLNFNYTSTLEVLYGIQKVHHIHKNENQEIIIGHGKDADFSFFDDDMFIGIFKKITSRQIDIYRTFFSSLKEITEIYSIGFSFSDVDLPYIKEICQNIDTKKVTWYLTKFDEERKNNEEYKKQIEKVIAELKIEGKNFPEIEFDIFDLEGNESPNKTYSKIPVFFYTQNNKYQFEYQK